MYLIRGREVSPSSSLDLPDGLFRTLRSLLFSLPYRVPPGLTMSCNLSLSRDQLSLFGRSWRGTQRRSMSFDQMSRIFPPDYAPS